MAKEKKGLSPQIYKGLSKSRMEKKTGGNRLVLKQGDSAVVQFLQGIEDFREYDQHAFQEKNRWNYVPCIGDNCPLCEDEDNDVAKISYRFCANVYSIRDKGVKIIEGPKDLAGRIAFRYEKAEKKKKGSFQKNTYEVSKLATTPVSYDVEMADDRPVSTDGLKLIDLDEYIAGEVTRYFGSDIPQSGSKSALDDDDDEATEEEYDQDELEEMDSSEIKSIAKNLGIKLKDKEGEPRTKKALIRLILKKQ